MAQFLSYLEGAYTVIWLIALIWCFKIGTAERIWSGLGLSLIYWGFWNPELFRQPAEMLSFHFLILIALIFTPANWYWRVYFAIVSMMGVADTIWRFMPNIQPMLEKVIPEMPNAFPYHLFWWQSLLILLFLALCFVTLAMNFLIHQRNKLTREIDDATIWAYIGHFIESAKNGGIGKTLIHGNSKRDR